MAYLQSTTIRSRIRALLEDEAGTLRKIADERFEGGYWTGSSDIAARARTISSTRYDIVSMGVQDEQLFSLIGSSQILRISPVIECDYTLAVVVDTDVKRDAVRATAEQDADVIQQSLAINLGTSDSTGVLQGSARLVSSTPITEDWENRRLVYRHEFTALVHVTF